MGLIATLNGSARGNGFLIAPVGGVGFPVPLGLMTDDGSRVTAALAVSPSGAGIEVSPSTIEVGGDEVRVMLHALSPSLRPNDTQISITRDGGLLEAINITAIEALFRRAI